jgi:hypothetical protein
LGFVACEELVSEGGVSASLGLTFTLNPVSRGFGGAGRGARGLRRRTRAAERLYREELSLLHLGRLAAANDGHRLAGVDAVGPDGVAVEVADRLDLGGGVDSGEGGRVWLGFEGWVAC